MSLKLPPRPARPPADPALTVVNLVLLLIFFFLLTGQDNGAVAELDLARTSDIPAGQFPPPVLEVLGPDDYRLDGQPVTPDLLATALPGDDRPVHLMIARDAPSGLLLSVFRRPELSDRPVRLVTQRQAP